MESFVAGAGVGLFIHLTTLYSLKWPVYSSTIAISLEPLNALSMMFRYGLGFMTFVSTD